MKSGGNERKPPRQHSILRTLGTGPEGVAQIQKIWRAWRPQADIDREIACHTAAEAASVAPKIYKVGRTGGEEPKLYMTMRALGRNFAQFAREEEDCVVAVALAEIEALYEALDKAGVIHNDGDPRNVMVDEADGRWYLVDFGKARMREDGDGGHKRPRTTTATGGHDDGRRATTTTTVADNAGRRQ